MVLCCFKSTATTEIYTYLHPLALHDALPIARCAVMTTSSEWVTPGRKQQGTRMYHPDLIRHPDSCPALVLNADYTPLSYYPLSVWPWQTAVKAVFLDRSEEHTSELQSLMRISYAVFCLKKTNKANILEH